ncbi:SUMF1/EgtB/PvdO family nonheme iron enzyme [Sulfuriroseicoccus oceanibius]|uniref:SUMF1/EgtB/PvdO family nonheme iron enzyme n=1 Tax=Sulfuriroseicoccus oceanibius TaxID=2707525 RepID=A0A6B3LAP3_9BACT|nr:SUMF1/EgtB/PvdO family nonheme iron enzyme [Sulfuriroseicoccus oceanibius]QQL46099.1 SUMF1/EgtB/PvdO family nonheme iron enzyme [Sulfuriroseicoccus oceanibius]
MTTHSLTQNAAHVALATLLACSPSLLIAQQRDGAPPHAPAEINGVKGSSILKLLGAKQEDGIDRKILSHYVDHFDRVDTNGDGFHSAQEYVENAGYKTRASRAGIFGAADSNRDGKVSKSEYILNRIITDEGKALISAMDDNGDGKTSEQEFLNNAPLTDKELARNVFDTLDRENSGFLATHQYLRVWGQWARSGKADADTRIARMEQRLETGASDTEPAPDRPTRPARASGERPQGGPPQGQRPSPANLLTRFDSDGDGKLRGDEIPERMKARLDHIDRNGDGIVTKDELERMGPPKSGQRPPREGNDERPTPTAPSKAGKPEKRPAESRSQIFDRSARLAKIDRNRDGRISKDEYRTHGPAALFAELDADHDGFLSTQESRWMMTFEPIPGGTFEMGSDHERSAGPAHQVEISAFSMGTTEVTTAQYCQYLNAALNAGEITVKLGDASGGGVRIFVSIPAYEVIGAPGSKFAGKTFTILSPVAGLSHVKLDGHPINIPEHPLNQSWIDYSPETHKFSVRPGFEDWPAVNIRWYGAKAFADHYGLDLPSEAQWEYAAKGGQNFRWASSTGEISGKLANFKCFASNTRHPSTDAVDEPEKWAGFRLPVGSYPANPFGLYDLGGNVWEWTGDWYSDDFYQLCKDQGTVRDPINRDGDEPPADAKGGPSGGTTHDARVVRGGSYQYHQATLSTTYRMPLYPFRGNDHFGFRVVSMSPESTTTRQP